MRASPDRRYATAIICQRIEGLKPLELFSYGHVMCVPVHWRSVYEVFLLSLPSSQPLLLPPMFCPLDSCSLKKNHESIASTRSIRGFFTRPRATLGKPAVQNAYQCTCQRKGRLMASIKTQTRISNWLHNGQGSGDTESGAYTLEGGTPIPTNGATVTRNGGASVFLTSEDEWYRS